MPKDNDIKENKQPTLVGTVFKTAIKTIVCIFAVCVVVFFALFFAVPSVGYDLANRMGMDKSALFFADKYAEDNIDGLVYCIELDKQLYYDTKDVKYARKLQKHTTAFFDYDTEYLKRYFHDLDEYYIKNSPKETQVQFYSYYDRVVALNYMANVILSEEKIIYAYNADSSFVDISFCDTNDYITTLFALNQAMSLGDDVKLPLVKDGKVTEFYRRILLFDEDTKTFRIKSVLEDLINNEPDKLRQLYMLRTCYFFAESAHLYLQKNAENYNGDFEWLLDNMQICGEKFNEAYIKLLGEYING